MNTMRHIHRARKLGTIAIVFWFIETAYFGFNLTAQSNAEKICDYIFKMGMGIAIAMYFLPLMEMYLKKVQEFDKENRK